MLHRAPAYHSPFISAFATQKTQLSNPTHHTIHDNSALTHRNRRKSMHALTPSALKPMTPRTEARLEPKTDRSTHYSSRQPGRASQSMEGKARDIDLMRNLFMDEQAVLKKLERQTEELEREKERVIAQNQQEYQDIIERLMEMRKLCNKRRQDIEALKNQFRELESKNSYKRVKEFTERRQSQNLPNPASKNFAFFQDKGGRQTYNIINSQFNF